MNSLKDFLQEIISKQGAIGIRETQLFNKARLCDYQIGTVLKEEFDSVMKELCKTKRVFKLTVNERIVYYFDCSCTIKLEY